MSRLSVAGTDEAGDTVKVAPEQTNQNTRVCVDTYISYIIYCIDIAGMTGSRKTYDVHIEETRCRTMREKSYGVNHRSQAMPPKHHLGRWTGSQTVVALVKQQVPLAH